ncbi:MAG: hypothetical protein JWM12_1370 [Ilumatobacteraceae bacterium]|nr:hypothetical protein [Ilumatobacteraceae bacterium]
MKFSPRTQTSNDSNVGRGLDLALVTLVFLGLGYVLDRILDTKPVFMIALFVFAVIGQFVKMWLGYDAKMKVLEAERAESSRSKAVVR